MMAVWKNGPEIVQAILNAGADATAQNENGATIVGLAENNAALRRTAALQQIENANTVQFCFWSDGDYNLNIYVNNTFVGKLTRHFASGKPVWGQEGTLVVNERPGTFTIVGRLENGEEVGALGTCTLSPSHPRMLWFFPSDLEIAAAQRVQTGQVCFWSNGSYTLDIFINGSFVGKLTRYFSSGTPTFGQEGTFLINEPLGAYQIVGKLENGAEVGGPTTVVLTTQSPRCFFQFPANLEIAAAQRGNQYTQAANVMGDLSSMAHSAAGVTGNGKFDKAGNILSGAQDILNILGGQ